MCVTLVVVRTRGVSYSQLLLLPEPTVVTEFQIVTLLYAGGTIKTSSTPIYPITGGFHLLHYKQLPTRVYDNGCWILHSCVISKPVRFRLLLRDNELLSIRWMTLDESATGDKFSYRTTVDSRVFLRFMYCKYWSMLLTNPTAYRKSI